MSNLIEKFLEDNSDVIVKVLRILEGKSASARIKLDGMQFDIGDSKIEIRGEIDLVFIPDKKKSKGTDSKDAVINNEKK